MATPVKTGSILAAALALPGLMPSAHAQVTVPNATLIQFKYLVLHGLPSHVGQSAAANPVGQPDDDQLACAIHAGADQ